MPETLYNDYIFQDFQDSPQAQCYSNIHSLWFDALDTNELVAIKEKSRDEKKCIFLMMNEAQWYDEGDIVSKQFKKFLQILRRKNIFNVDFYAPGFGDMYQKDFVEMNKNWLGWNFFRYDVGLPPVNEDAWSMRDMRPWTRIYDEHIKYKFVYMNFTHRLHRQLFSKYLVANNMLENNCVAINLTNDMRTPEDGRLHRPIGEIIVGANPLWSLTKKLSELWENTELVQHSNPDINNNYDQSHYDFVTKAGVYIVSETAFDHPHPQFTEKTVSALLSRRPFVIVGAAGCLRTLKKKGYKTFDNIFDESYDNIVDPCARMEKIFELVEQINNRSIDQIKQNVLQCEDKLRHNRQLALETIKRYNKNDN